MLRAQLPAWLKIALQFLAISVLGALCLTYLVLGHVESPRLLLAGTIAAALFSILMVSLILAITIHELGHLVAGLIAGMHFRSLNIFGVSLTRAGAAWRIKSAPSTFTGGLVIMIPPDSERLVARYRLFILGGPIASCIYAAIVASLAWITWPRPFASLTDGVVALALFGLAVFAILILPGTLLPFASKGHSTDMKLLLELSGQGPRQRRIVCLLTIGRFVASAVPATEWPEELILPLSEPQDGSLLEVQSSLVAYYWFLDHGRRDEALSKAERALSISRSLGASAGALLDYATYEVAYLSALVGDVGRAESLLNTQPSDPMSRETYHRARAALALVRRDFASCLRELDLCAEALEWQEKRLGLQSATIEGWVRLLRARVESLRSGVQVAAEPGDEATTPRLA